MLLIEKESKCLGFSVRLVGTFRMKTHVASGRFMPSAFVALYDAVLNSTIVHLGCRRSLVYPRDEVSILPINSHDRAPDQAGLWANYVSTLSMKPNSNLSAKTELSR
jgi:hypothetical protein